MAAPLLLGLGLHEWSMSPSSIHKVKEVNTGVSQTACRELAERVLELDTPEEVRRALEEFRQSATVKLIRDAEQEGVLRMRTGFFFSGKVRFAKEARGTRAAVRIRRSERKQGGDKPKITRTGTNPICSVSCHLISQNMYCFLSAAALY